MEDNDYIALGKAFELFLTNDRFHILGTAGLGCTDYQHMGMEVWTNYANVSEGVNESNKQIIYKYILGMKGVDQSKEDKPDIEDLITAFKVKKKNSRFTPDLSFIENDEWKRLYQEWVDNKKSPFKKQIGVKKGFTELFNISHYDIETAQKIVDKSLANNWSGLFSIGNNYESKPNQETPGKSGYDKLQEKYGR